MPAKMPKAPKCWRVAAAPVDCAGGGALEDPEGAVPLLPLLPLLPVELGEEAEDAELAGAEEAGVELDPEAGAVEDPLLPDDALEDPLLLLPLEAATKGPMTPPCMLAGVVLLEVFAAADRKASRVLADPAL